jgi:hypothetical protein
VDTIRTRTQKIVDTLGAIAGTLLIAVALLLVMASLANGQETQVRHYATEVIELEEDVFQMSHIMIGGDGQMALIVQTGDEERARLAVGFSGPRNFTDVQEDGTTAFCFTIDESFVDGEYASDEVRAFAQSKHGDKVCVVWLETDEMYITNGPFGEARSAIMNWCGEDHLLQPARNPNARGT